MRLFIVLCVVAIIFHSTPCTGSSGFGRAAPLAQVQILLFIFGIVRWLFGKEVLKLKPPSPLLLPRHKHGIRILRTLGFPLSESLEPLGAWLVCFDVIGIGRRVPGNRALVTSGLIK